MERIHGRPPDGTPVEGVEVFRRLYAAVGVRAARAPDAPARHLALPSSHTGSSRGIASRSPVAAMPHCQPRRLDESMLHPTIEGRRSKACTRIIRCFSMPSSRRSVSVQFRDKTGAPSHACAPLDYGPLCGATDQADRYQLWDLEGKAGSRSTSPSTTPTSLAVPALDETFGSSCDHHVGVRRTRGGSRATGQMDLAAGSGATDV